MKKLQVLLYTWLLLPAFLIFMLTSCDKRIRKQGSGHVVTTERSLSDFQEIDAEGSFDIFIHHASQPRITITCDDNLTSEVETFVQDQKLVIDMSDDYFNYRFTEMTLHIYTDDLSKVDLNGNMDCEVLDTLHLQECEWIHNGSGRSIIRFDGSDLRTTINGSGSLEAHGNTVYQKIVINGSAKMDVLGMQAVNTDAEIHGSGTQYVHCSGVLNATIDGSGKIRYTGDPQVISSISGSGSVGPY